jgi:hypothetical protein
VKALVLTLAVAALLATAGTSGGARASDPGKLPQTTTLPSATTPWFKARMAALWRGIVRDVPSAARSAFFPRSAYLQVKAIPAANSDFRQRLLRNFDLDIHAAHSLLGRGVRTARLVGVRVPREWAWIQPGYCYNHIGYWHAPGSRLIYTQGGALRSLGIYSLISWRGQWYVVHLGPWNRPGTVDTPAAGAGTPDPPGGC